MNTRASTISLTIALAAQGRRHAILPVQDITFIFKSPMEAGILVDIFVEVRVRRFINLRYSYFVY